MMKKLVIVLVVLAVPVAGVLWFRSEVADFQVRSTEANNQVDTIFRLSVSLVDSYAAPLASAEDLTQEQRNRIKQIRAARSKARDELSPQEKVQVIHSIQSDLFALMASVSPEQQLHALPEFKQLQEAMNWKSELRNKMQEYNQSVLLLNNMIESQSLTANLVGDAEPLPFLSVEGFVSQPDIRI